MFKGIQVEIGGASVKDDVVSASSNVSVKWEHLCYKPSLLALY